MSATARHRPESSSGHAAADEPGPRRDRNAWLLAAAALSIAPHVANLPPWVSALCAALLIWYGWRSWRGQAAPARWLLAPIALGAAIGVRLSLGQLLGKTPGLALLAILLGLKLLESRNMRDIRVVVLLCFFLQFGLFFNNQSLPAAAFALFAALLTLGSQISLADPIAGARERLRLSAVLLVQGLPFMLVFFILFPRAISPLWGIPNDALSISGLSDSMSPGTISELVLSDELAFTAEFDGPRPPPPERYWRGPVLTAFDGRTWRMAGGPMLDRPAYTPSGRRYDYRIMLEPHHQRWLPALDYPAGPVRGVRFTHDFQAVSRAPVDHRMQFRLSAFPRAEAGGDEAPWTLEQSRRLPAHGNPRARGLAARLKAPTPGQTVERILSWLTENDFTYTLQPPLLDENSIDFFLFNTRMGFCEHFAGAFVFLARAADLPARVVTGYQGGRVNPVNGALTLRQSDAHAWAEVWFSGRGWIRVDPTALIAPLRIERGLENSLPAGESLPLMLRPQYQWLRQLRDRWEAVATTWNRLVITYDNRRQRDLLETFGLDPASPPRVFGAIGIASALLLAAFYYWARRRRNTVDPLDRAWARFSARLARRGLARAPSEGPLDYGRRLAAARPADAAALTAICTSYARLRYRPPAPHREICKLIHSVDHLILKEETPRPR